MTNKTEIKHHYHKQAQPPLSLVFAIDDMKLAALFHRFLQQHGALSPASDSITAADSMTAELRPLFDLLQAYGVTIAREYELMQRELMETTAAAIARTENLAPQDAFRALVGTAGGAGLFAEGMTRFLVTAPNQADLMRLHHDLGVLASRERPWLRPLSFKDNSAFLAKTLDQAMARMRDMDFHISLGCNRLMSGMGPEKAAGRRLRLAETADEFCRPAQPAPR